MLFMARIQALPLISIIVATNLINDAHREKLYFTQFSTRIYWNRSLAASDFFHVFTLTIKFYTFHCQIFKTTDV